MEKPAEEGAARKTESPLEHPMENYLLVRCNEWEIVGGRSAHSFRDWGGRTPSSTRALRFSLVESLGSNSWRPEGRASSARGVLFFFEEEAMAGVDLNWVLAFEGKRSLRESQRKVKVWCVGEWFDLVDDSPPLYRPRSVLGGYTIWAA